MSDDYQPPPRGWFGKFRDAFAGVGSGMRGQVSFAVHIPVAIAVILAGFWLRVDRTEWCLLILCIATVISAELFNSALEVLAKAIDRSRNPHLAIALNIASGAVLVVAVGAALVGSLIFLPHVAPASLLP